jgi:hypothetical protein
LKSARANWFVTVSGLPAVFLNVAATAHVPFCSRSIATTRNSHQLAGALVPADRDRDSRRGRRNGQRQHEQKQQFAHGAGIDS